MAAIPRRVDLALLGAFEALPRRSVDDRAAGGRRSWSDWSDAGPPATWLPQLAVSARWAAGTPDQTAALVRRLGTSSRTAARARRQVARLALRYGLLDAARDVLATIPEARQPEFEMVRARQAVEEGRYEAARVTPSRLLAAGRPTPRVTSR